MYFHCIWLYCFAMIFTSIALTVFRFYEILTAILLWPRFNIWRYFCTKIEKSLSTFSNESAKSDIFVD